MKKNRIVIVGGGFAGVKCAQTLSRKVSLDTSEIILFNEENHMVFHPLLPEVAGVSLNPDSVTAPLRQMLPHVFCRTEQVEKIHPAENRLEYWGHDKHLRSLHYDQLVVCPGAVVNLGIVPGMADHSFPLKNVGDAITLRHHIMSQLEKADVCDDPELKKSYLSFIIVGGGFSGVEVAGEINDFLKASHQFYPHVTYEDCQVILIEGSENLLPPLSPKLRTFTKDRMRKAGIHLKLKTGVSMVTPEGVVLKDGNLVKGQTVVSTIGMAVAPVVRHLDVPKERNRVLTEPDMRIQGLKNVWAIGDCAIVKNHYDNKLCVPTGQFAERQGKQAALNIARFLQKKETKPFYYKPAGQLCSIGGHVGVAEIFGWRISGFLAWFMWRGIYLMKMPTWQRRLKVGFDWAWQLFFSRDLAHPKSTPSDRISSATYQAGDYIFRQGDPALNFYVVEKGEAQVVRKKKDSDQEEVLALLGPGDFFGEWALLDNRPRQASVRAMSDMEIVVMGKSAFDQISNTLTPLKDMFLMAIKRRASSIWEKLPQAKDILEKTKLSDFVENLPSKPLQMEATFEEALHVFNEKNVDYCGVVDQGDVLKGILTRSDIFRAIEGGSRLHTMVSEFMVTNPISITKDDTTLVAASTMRDHKLKWLPVIEDRNAPKLLGFVKAQRLLEDVLHHLPDTGDV